MFTTSYFHQFNTTAVTGYLSTGWNNTPVVVPPPKHWRWFDIFRTWRELPIVVELEHVLMRPWRGQARADIVDVRRTKRRFWLHTFVAK